jgi:hypothetical protein
MFHSTVNIFGADISAAGIMSIKKIAFTLHHFILTILVLIDLCKFMFIMFSIFEILIKQTLKRKL